MTQLAFSFDVNRCSGCMACVVACQDQNDFKAPDVAFRHITPNENPDETISFMSLSCLHCGEAPCLMVCPSGAISRKNNGGVIEIDRDLCVGCHSCVLACPFGAPKFPNDGRMAKCDFCSTRMTHGLKPACVRVCTTRALDFGPLDNIATQKAEASSKTILNSIEFCHRNKE